MRTRRQPRRAGRLEAGEIVRADERRGRRCIASHVQPLIDVPDILAVKQVRQPAVLNHVAIPLADGVAEGVKAGGGFRDFEDQHVFRQLGIQGLGAARSGEAWSRKRKLTTCPNAWTPASVRPLATHFVRRLRDPLQRRLQLPLHRPLPRLPLPAGEIRPVVGEGELEGGHKAEGGTEGNKGNKAKEQIAMIVNPVRPPARRDCRPRGGPIWRPTRWRLPPSAARTWRRSPQTRPAADRAAVG